VHSDSGMSGNVVDMAQFYQLTGLAARCF
jgi:hypothetical protein